MKTLMLAALLVAMATAEDAASRRDNSSLGVKLTGFSSVVVHKGAGSGGLTVQEPPKGWPFSEVNINFPGKQGKEPAPRSKPAETQTSLASSSAPSASGFETLRHLPPKGWHYSQLNMKLPNKNKDLFKPTESQITVTTAPGFESQKHSSLPPLKINHHQQHHQQHNDGGIEYLSVDIKNSTPKKRIPKSRHHGQSSAINVGYSIGFSTPPDAFKPGREMVRLIGNSQQHQHQQHQQQHQQPQHDSEIVHGKPIASYVTQSQRKPRLNTGQLYEVVKETQHEEQPYSSASFYQGVPSDGHAGDERKYVWRNLGSNIEVSSNMAAADNTAPREGRKNTGGRGQHHPVYYVNQGTPQFDHAHALGHSDAFDMSNAVLGNQQTSSTRQNPATQTALSIKDHALFVQQGHASENTGVNHHHKVPSSLHLGYTFGSLYPEQQQQQQQHQESAGDVHVKSVVPKGNVVTPPPSPYTLGHFGAYPQQVSQPNAYLAGIHTGGHGHGATIPALVIPMASLANLASVLQGLQQPAGHAIPVPLFPGQPMPFATVPLMLKQQPRGQATRQQPPQQHVQQQHYNLLLANTRPVISQELFKIQNVLPYMHQHFNNQKTQLVKQPQGSSNSAGTIKLQQSIPYYHINIQSNNKDNSQHQSSQQSTQQSGHDATKLQYYQHIPVGNTHAIPMIPLQDVLKMQPSVHFYHPPAEQQQQQHTPDSVQGIKYVQNIQPQETASSILGQNIQHIPNLQYLTKLLQQSNFGQQIQTFPSVQYITTKPVQQQQQQQQQSAAADKEQLHRDILAQQRALAGFNSMLSLALFPQVKPTASPTVATVSQGNASAYPLASSYVLDLKPPPVPAARS